MPDQSNEAGTTIDCGTSPANEKGSYEFLCPADTAADIVTITKTTATSPLAEVVIAGNPWDAFPCRKGHYEAGDGTHTNDMSDTGCTECAAGYHQSEIGQTSCTQCASADKLQFYTATLDDKMLPECQVCDESKVVKLDGDLSTCVPCDPGTIYTAMQGDGSTPCTTASENDRRTCNSIKCEDCPPGKYRADGMQECQYCPVNEFSIGGSCSRCPVNTHSDGTQATCYPCKGATIQEILAQMRDTDNTPFEQYEKCIVDTGTACPPATITSRFGVYDLQFSEVNTNQTFDCTYDGAALKAVFICEADTQQYNPIYNCIRTNNTQSIEDIAAINDTNIKEKSELFKEATEIRPDETYGIGDIDAASSVIDSITSEDEDVDKEILENVLIGVSRLLDADLRTNSTAEAEIIKKGMVESLKIITDSTTDKNLLTSTNNVAAIKIDSEEEVNDMKSSGGFKSTNFYLPNSEYEKGHLGAGLTMEVDDQKDLILTIETNIDAEVDVLDMTVVLLSNHKLFPTDENDSNVTSMVAEVTINQEMEGSLELDLYIRAKDKVNAPITNDDGTRELIGYTCVSYKPETLTWDSEGCETVYDTTGQIQGAMCYCDHNTSFAVLMSPVPIDPKYSSSQSTLSNVLLTFSILCLTVTLVLFAPFKELRSTRAVKVNICFSLALLLASFFFVLQGALVKDGDNGPIKSKSAGCIVYAMIQHYLWLVVFCWMMIEGFVMYLSLVQVFGSHISKYMLKFNLFAWTVPLLFPIIGYFAFSKRISLETGETLVVSTYIDDHACFLKPGELPFYLLFFLPMVLVIVTNIVFFVMVLKVIKGSKNVAATDREMLLRQMKSATGVMILLGTGWSIGVFMAVPAASVQLTLQYFFILLNATQGIFVFVFYTVLNETVVDRWLTLLGLKKPKGSGSTKSTTVSVTAKTETSSAVNPAKEENVYENTESTKAAKDHTYDTAAGFPATQDSGTGKL